MLKKPILKFEKPKSIMKMLYFKLVITNMKVKISYFSNGKTDFQVGFLKFNFGISNFNLEI